jgi:hypothetical protein
MGVACGVLKAGGIAVKVESAGVAQSAQDWFDFAQDRHPAVRYHAFVTLFGGSGTYSSFGMHCLGLRDTIVVGEVPCGEAAQLVQGFPFYTLVEQPVMHSRETFSLEAQSPHYRIAEEACETYPSGHLFHNPFGMGRLLPA